MYIFIYTHKHAHTHTHTRIHTHAHTRTHTHKFKHIYKHTHTRAHSFCQHIHTRAHVFYTRARLFCLARTHTQSVNMYTYVYSCYMCLYIFIHTRVYVCTYGWVWLVCCWMGDCMFKQCSIAPKKNNAICRVRLFIFFISK